MALDRQQHVAETAEHMRADRLALERAGDRPYPPLSAETQKWFDQNQTRRSANPVSAASAASSRALASAR